MASHVHHDHHDHEHQHGENHADHLHAHGHRHGAGLTWALVFTLGFAIVEVIGGILSGSLALLSDAGHMVSDVAALALAAFAQRLATRPPSSRHSYGLGRAEVVAALINGLLMLAVIAWIAVEAVQRLLAPHPVAGGTVMVVAGLGLLVNVIVAFVLSRDAHSLNTRAALLHVMGDLLGSVAALLAGAVIQFTGWMPIDPILSVLVAGLILFSTISLIRHTLQVLMEGVPADLDFEEIGKAIAAIPGVQSAHDLHVWSLGSGKVALSAHLALSSLDQWPRILPQARLMLKQHFAIEHVTLQPEPTDLSQHYQVRIPIIARD